MYKAALPNSFHVLMDTENDGKFIKTQQVGTDLASAAPSSTGPTRWLEVSTCAPVNRCDLLEQCRAQS